MNIRIPLLQRPIAPIVNKSKMSLPSGWRDRLTASVVVSALALFAVASASAQVTLGGTTTQLASGFYVPLGIALDKSNNVYVADWSSAHVVKEYKAVNGVVAPGQSYVGLGGYVDLYDLTVDGNGNIFITTYGDCNVQEIMAVNGSVPVANPTVRTLYNDSATYAGYCSTDGIALDAAGDVYFTDINAGTVTELVAVGGVVPNNPTAIQLGGSGWTMPRDVKVDASGNVWVADYTAKKITEMPAGCVSTSCVTTAYQVTSAYGPFNLIFDAAGDLFYSDYNAHNIWEIAAVGGVIPANPTPTLVSATGELAAELAVDAKGNIYYPADGNNPGAFEFSPSPSALSFGSVNLGSSATQTIGINIAAGQTIGAISYLTKGAPNLDFASGGGTCTAKTYTTATSCTITVKFSPTAAGQRIGAVRIVDGASPTPNVLFTEYVSGIGIAPLATFPGVISTYAGGPQGLPQPACTGQTNSVGDGCVATQAFLNTPHLLATDGAGNVYISDYQNQEIRKVDVNTGIITSVAGSATLGAGYSGDGGPATQAQLTYPWGEDLDGAGNLYVADFGNNLIRRVDAVTGIITTVAGQPQQRGINIGNGGPATSAQLSLPSSVKVDGAGNLYIVDSYNTVRMVNAATGIISIVAGSGTANNPLACPSPTATCGDNGPATSALLNNPVDVAVDGAGNLYITDKGDERVRMVTASTGTITTIAGNGSRTPVDNVPATSSGFYNMYGLVVDPSGNVIVGDSQNMKVRKINMSTGIITTIAGTGAQNYSGDGGPPTSATFYLPSGLALDSTGNLYISDVLNFVIRKINTGTTASHTFNTTSIGSASTDSPYTFTLSNAGSGPLVFTTPSSGTNPLFAGSASSYSLSNSSTCPQVSPGSSTQSLAAGQSCTYLVNFSPTSTGNAATLTIKDNNAPTTQVITLGGTGVQTSVAPSVATVSAVSTAYGSTTGVTVTATESGSNGSASGDVVSFSITGSATGSFNPTSCIIGSGGTCTVTYTPTGSLSAGTYSNNISASFASGANYLAASGTSTLTVTQLTPTVMLGSSVNPILVQNQTTLTATVSSSAGTPTGSVTFLDGATPLGLVKLSGGVAMLPVSFTSTGTHLLTASYAVTQNYTQAGSTTVNESVQDFSMNITVAGSTPIGTVAPGGTAQYALLITPLNATTFPASITLSASGLPTGATPTFSPVVIPAGNGATPVTLTIAVPYSKFGKIEPGGGNRNLVPIAFGLLLLPLARRFRRKARGLGRGITLSVLLLAGIDASAGLSGCSTSSGFFSQEPVAYNLTVTGTSGSLSHSANVTLTVQ